MLLKPGIINYKEDVCNKNHHFGCRFLSLCVFPFEGTAFAFSGYQIYSTFYDSRANGNVIESNFGLNAISLVNEDYYNIRTQKGTNHLKYVESNAKIIAKTIS